MGYIICQMMFSTAHPDDIQYTKKIARCLLDPIKQQNCNNSPASTLEIPLGFCFTHLGFFQFSPEPCGIFQKKIG